MTDPEKCPDDLKVQAHGVATHVGYSCPVSMEAMEERMCAAERRAQKAEADLAAARAEIGNGSTLSKARAWDRLDEVMSRIAPDLIHMLGSYGQNVATRVEEMHKQLAFAQTTIDRHRREFDAENGRAEAAEAARDDLKVRVKDLEAELSTAVNLRDYWKNVAKNMGNNNRKPPSLSVQRYTAHQSAIGGPVTFNRSPSGPWMLRADLVAWERGEDQPTTRDEVIAHNEMLAERNGPARTPRAAALAVLDASTMYDAYRGVIADAIAAGIAEAVRPWSTP